MGARSGGGRENSSRQALVVKREGVERGGEIQGVKRRLRLRAGVEGGGSRGREVEIVVSRRRQGGGRGGVGEKGENGIELKQSDTI